MSVTAQRIGPQPGPQMKLLRSTADIVFMGGAAGGGKSYGLLMDAARNIGIPNYGATIYRRVRPLLYQTGSLWDQATELYGGMGAHPYDNSEYRFPRRARVKFDSLPHESDKTRMKGAQMPYVGFDQIEEFEESQFWYAVSRMRTTLPVSPKLRCTCNPQPGWLAELLAWWIDNDGFARKDRADMWRWFIRDGDEIIWETWREDFPASDRDDALSIQFIPATLDDNPILMRQSPRYMARLKALPYVERQRLLHGNWKIIADAGNVFHRSWFLAGPKGDPSWPRVRYWDTAGTAGGGAYSAGVLMCLCPDGSVVVEHVERGQWSSGERNDIILETAEIDGYDVTIVVEQEPGGTGKESAEKIVRMLTGYKAFPDSPGGPKWERWKHLSAQAEFGRCFVAHDHDLPPLQRWRRAFLDEMHNASVTHAPYLDQVDAASAAFIWLTVMAPKLGFRFA